MCCLHPNQAVTVAEVVFACGWEQSALLFGDRGNVGATQGIGRPEQKGVIVNQFMVIATHPSDAGEYEGP